MAKTLEQTINNNPQNYRHCGLKQDKLTYLTKRLTKDGEMLNVEYAMYNGVPVLMSVNGEAFGYGNLPCIYIILEKKTGIVYYAGATYEPLNRYSDHFGKNTYVSENGEDKNNSKFYLYVKENNLSFDDFTIGFFTLDCYLDENGELQQYCPVRQKQNPVEIDYAEAYFQTLLLEHSPLEVQIYREEDGSVLFLTDIKADRKGTNIRRINYTQKYKDEHGAFDPVLECVKYTEKMFSVEEMQYLLQKRAEHTAIPEEQDILEEIRNKQDEFLSK